VADDRTTRGDSTPVAELARAGMLDHEAAQRHLSELGPVDERVLGALTASPDPDLALRTLSRLVAAGGPSVLTAMTDSSLLRDRLAVVLGTSAALGDHLIRHPTAWRELAAEDPAAGMANPTSWRRQLLAAVGADAAAISPVATLADAAAVDALRVSYRLGLLQVVARDLTEGWALDTAGAVLADLATAALEAALAIARARLGEPARTCRLAVIAMGKAGGRELNYVSDVDVVFVCEPADGASAQEAVRTGARLAAHMMRICSERTREGSLWEVDAGLRPEGRAGPLVRTLDSHVAYYAKWARTWEFQALLKARPAAGDQELGRQYVATLTPLVWQAADRDGFVSEVQAMRRRVVENLPPGTTDRELKLGPGGLRDVEFAVQLLQLVHGRSDESLRSPATLPALAALTAGGYVGREDGATMAQAYQFLRALEHRVQLHQLRRTHRLPDSEADLRRLGRSLGYRADPAGQLEAEWRRQRWEVRRLHEKLFYRPLLAAVAALPGEGMRLSPEAAQARLSALGYADPRAALTHLDALTAGVSRRAAIQRQLLPVMLSWFADAPAPDAGLRAFRSLSERLGGSHWYLRQLRDESLAAQQLARVLSFSRYATDLLANAPEAVAMLGNDAELRPRSSEQLTAEVTAASRRHADPHDAVRAVRAMRRRELCRTSIADVLGRLDIEEVGAALSDVSIATLDGALAAAHAAVSAEWGRPLPMRLAVIAMGRLGGHESGYGSDADVMFVHDAASGAEDHDAAAAAGAVAQTMRQLLAMPGDDPAMTVDADLRPEGRSGPLTRSLASYAAYYRRWSAPWEAQALLRAEPVLGDAKLCAEFATLIAPLRWPPDGVSEDSVQEIRRIKSRVDAERLPRGADPATHLKLGRGALADVEWTVQLLQLRHGHRVAGLRTTRTLPALRAAVAAGLLDGTDGDELATAWRLASRLRNAITLVRGRHADTLPRDRLDRATVAGLLGYPATDTGRLEDDYRRTARRSRAAVERVFYS